MDFYEVLGVSRDADTAEIRRVYKKLALTHHPDKVAEPEREQAEIRFKEISEAYETLGDAALRAEYDAGMRSSWQDWYGGGVYEEASDFFNATGEDEFFFGFSNGASGHSGGGSEYSSGGRHRTNGNGNGYSHRHANGAGNGAGNGYSNGFNGRSGASIARTDDAVVEVEVPLEDVYKGRLLKLSSSRQVLCSHCQGTGARPTAKSRECPACEGHGVKKQMRPIAPGIMAATTIDCSKCHGQGKIYRSKDRCRHCHGGQVEERSIFEIYIPRGAPNDYEVVLEGKSDEALGKQTGNIIIRVSVQPHERFRREGLDLYARASISLKEALTGLSRPLVEQLDGRQLRPTVPRGTVIYPGQILKIANEGLVLDGDAAAGDMYVQLDIIFPKASELNEQSLDQLSQLLPGLHGPESTPKQEDEHVNGNSRDQTHEPPNTGLNGEPHMGSQENKGPVEDIEHQLVEVDELPSYENDDTASYAKEKTQAGCTPM